MAWFYNMKIGKKLILSFVIVALLAGVLGVIGLTNLRNEDASYSKLYTDYGAGTTDMGYLGMDVYMISIKVRDTILRTDPKEIQNAVDAIKEAETDLNMRIDRIKSRLCGTITSARLWPI